MIIGREEAFSRVFGPGWCVLVASNDGPRARADRFVCTG